MDDAAASPARSGTATPVEEIPPRLPTKFVACVHHHASGKRVQEALSAYSTDVNVLVDENLKGVKQADVVLLGCKPQMFASILKQDGILEALAGRMLISILAGVSVNQIEETLYGSISDKDPASEGRCRIVRVMPNTASSVRESMTVISTPTIPIPAQEMGLVTWIFNRIGKVVHLPPDKLDASTALCGSGPAFVALILEAMADGAVAMGIPRIEAQFMAAQTMRGTTGMVLAGEHPAMLRDKVCTPGGCTIGGLLKLEEGTVRGTVSRAIREATVVASQLGKGVQGVNGTRF